MPRYQWLFVALLLRFASAKFEPYDDEESWCGVQDESDVECDCVENKDDLFYGHFYCRDRNASLLPMAEFPAGRCQDTSIASLQRNLFTNYPMLLRDGRFERISLAENRLTSLPRSHQVSRNVEKLNLSSNKISNTSDELKNMARLKILRLSWNNLTTLGFLPNPCNLQELDVSGNAISAIESQLKTCSSLETLDLSFNLITSLPENTFSALENLRDLFLSNNYLVTIDDRAFSGLYSLQSLHIRNANLTNVSKEVFNELITLYSVSLSDNHLRSLPDGIFGNVLDHMSIDLTNNYLTALPDCIFPRSDPGIFSGMNRLHSLQLNENNLTPAPTPTYFQHPSMTVLMRGNPLQAHSLRWVLHVPDLQKEVKTYDCKCGSLQRGNSSVNFCVNVSCGFGQRYRDWLEAVTDSSNTVYNVDSETRAHTTAPPADGNHRRRRSYPVDRKRDVRGRRVLRK